MQPTVTSKQKPEPRRPKDNCCDELSCDSGLRNNYYDGKRLTSDMFKVEQRYLTERRHLLNRALHGTGVVYGYSVEAGSLKEGKGGQVSRRLAIGEGLAFDQCGRELLQASKRGLNLDDVTVLGKDGKPIDRDEAFARVNEDTRIPGTYRKDKDPDIDDRRECWLLSVHYAEQRDGHITIPDPCQCDRHEWDRICETVRYTLRRIRCEECCLEEKCGLDCDCGSGYCCDPRRTQRETPQEPQAKQVKDERLSRVRAELANLAETGAFELDVAPAGARPLDRLRGRDLGDKKDESEKDNDDTSDRPDLPFRRGGCRCICDYQIGLEVESSCHSRLVEIEEPCGSVWVDLKHGVPIACLGLIPDDCGGWTFGETVDPCGPRPLVKRTDVLFDLIRGCDLTRLLGISWSKWHRSPDAVAFKDFAEFFGALGADPAEYETKFEVTFSRPVRKRTLGPDCFAITIVSFEPADRGWQTARVPILRVITGDAQPGDPAGHVRSARLVVGRAWIEDGLNGWGGPFNGETWVEIEVRGDFILDCNGQPVDANAVGRLPVPTGNGTPGGTFLSTFRVEARPPRPGGSGRYEQFERSKGASS